MCYGDLGFRRSLVSGWDRVRLGKATSLPADYPAHDDD